MKTNKLLYIATASLLMTACSGEEVIDLESPVEAQVSALISGSNTRTAVDQTNSDNTNWVSGDCIGISGTSGSVNYENVQYSTSSDGDNSLGNFVFSDNTVGKSKIYFHSTADANFSAYYPYAGDGTISLSTGEQTSDSQSNLDILYAEAKATYANPMIAFNFKHKMARIKVTFRAGDGISSDLIANGKFSIAGLKHSGTFSASTGQITLTGEASDDYKEIKTNCTTVTNEGNSTYTYSMIVLPQEVTKLNFAAKLTVDGNDETYTTETAAISSAKFDEGKSYNYVITVTRYGLIINSSTIDPWGKTEDKSGNATIKNETGTGAQD